MLKSIKNHMSKFSKVISITHSDFDGVISAMVVKKYCMANYIEYSVSLASYNNIDSKLDALKHDKKFTKDTLLVITDIFPKDVSSLDYFIKHNQLLLIDHHETSAEHHNTDHMIYSIPSHGSEGMSAALLTFKLFECDSVANLKDMCEICSVYDLWKLDSPLRKKSEDLNVLFQMYWEKMIDAFIDGRTEFNEKELKFIKSEEDRFKNVWDSIDFYDIDEYPEIPGKFFITSDFVNDVCSKVFDDNPEVKICFGYSAKSKTLSVRSLKSLDVNLGDILYSLGIGGGHANSSGIRTANFSIEWLVETINIVMKEINSVILQSKE